MVNLANYYQPHDGQIAVHESNAKEKYNQAGRRWGKDRCGLGELLDNYVQWRKDYAAGLRDPWLEPGFHCWAVVPSYSQGRQIWHEMLRFIPSAFIQRKQDEELILYLRGPDSSTYAFVELKSAHDPEALQTVGLDFLWISESQDISDRAWEKLYPTTSSPGRYGRIYANGIPSMWPDHWFQRVYEQSGRDTSGQMAQFHYTAFDNPLLDEKELAAIERAKEVMTDSSWKRMYLAQFNINSGFFRNIDGCIAGDQMSAPTPGRYYVGGLDFGISNDATVLTIMDMENRKVANRYRWDSTTWPVMREHIFSLQDTWGMQRIACDTSNMGGIVMFQELEQGNLPVEEFKFQGENRQNYLGNLQVAIERATITFPMIDTLVRQLRQFQYIRLSTGQYKVQAPQGEQDDEVMSLALALQVCSESIQSAAMPARTSHGRYVPTQREMQSGIVTGLGGRILKERKLAKMKTRMERSGVV